LIFPAMPVTEGLMQQKLVKRRVEEAKQGELRRRLAENNILIGHGTSAVRVENKRRARSEAAERRELLMDFTHVNSQKEKIRKAQISQFEDHLADELSRLKAAEHREAMDRRRICDGSEELRALKERLHVAKCNKERAQQLLSINMRDEEERLREHKIAEHMENERLKQIDLEHQLNSEKFKQRASVKTINQQQIIDREKLREESKKEFLIERAQVEELVQKIAKEDAEEAKARQEKQDETKAMLNRFMVEQREKQEQMERDEKAEYAAIEQYAADKRAREERLAQEKAEKEKEKTRILNAMLGQMAARNKEAEDFEQLCNDLHSEELEAAGRRREELQMRKKMEDQEEMKRAHSYQMKMKEERAERMRSEDNDMRDSLMKKFAEDDRLEQMNEHKRRMKVEAHKREADRLVAVRREMYEKEREAEKEVDARLRVDEGKRQQVIEAERKRLIAEHASELRDFLPKGTLETVDDYDLMFNKQQSGKDVSV